MRRALVVLVVVLAGCAGTFPSSPDVGGEAGDTPTGGSVPSADLTVRVTRVVDGDTLKVEYENGTADTVRLVGVDTPEVHAENTPDEFEGVPGTAAGRRCLRRWGERASAYAEERLAGERVGLAFDPNLDHRGYYDRLLAYVVADGRNVNYALVANGYARVYDSDFARKDRFLAAERRARADGTGLWTCATGGPSPTDDGRADGGVAVTEIHADAAGNDNENLNDEYVVLTNRGDATVDLAGWTVSDAAGKTYEFGNAALAPGERITLHTGSGTDTANDRYWGRDGAVWNNGGDTVTVRAANGTVVAERSY